MILLVDSITLDSVRLVESIEGTFRRRAIWDSMADLRASFSGIQK